MSVFKAITALFASIHCCAALLCAQTIVPPPSTQAVQTIIVGIFDAPPYSEPVTQPDGKIAWEGSSIRLLESMTTDLRMKLVYRSGTEQEILDALAAGTVDVCASPLAPTIENMTRFQFSYAYTAIGIAAATRMDGALESTFELLLVAVWAPEKTHLYLITLIFLLCTALAVWCVERRQGGHFESHPWRGIGASLWWSIVTLATVGYGDKVPESFIGRLIACGWMLTSLILTALLTATIVSAITLHGSGRTTLHSSADLFRLRVATVQSGVAADWLTALGVSFIQSNTLDDALQMLEEKRVDAVVAPATSLAQSIRTHDDLTIVSTRFAEEYMSFGIAPTHDDAFLRRFNIALVNAIPRLAKHDSARMAPPIETPPNPEPRTDTAP
ncbi:MAG: transporter substrate-binding domain-containing protein [Phycisphaerales bacterium]|nr:transporter substrate-binding domain-containing protein [Phycisphaerales bacterium]